MIKHKNRIKQVIDFSGVGDSKIHPTDIDAVLEFDDKYLLLFEVKYKGLKAPLGQEILFNRIADCWQSVKEEAFVIYCEHETKSSEIVNLYNTRVVSVYHKKIKHNQDCNLFEFLNKIANHYNITKLIKSLNYDKRISQSRH
mgnify:CR=1 FL=1